VRHDERSGIEGSLAIVRDRFIDTGRFSRNWILTVNDLNANLDKSG
jgi:hypothetical protein